MSKIMRYVVSLLLLMVSPAYFLFAETGAVAMLYAPGGAMVNGAGVPRTAALFRGDTVQTADTGSVTISLAGSTVLVPVKSRVVFHGESLELNSGVVEVNTSKGMSAKTDVYTMSPAKEGTARFEVARLSDAVLIRAEKGDLLVTGTSKPMTVAEGTSEMLDLQEGGPGTAPPAGATGGAKIDKRKALFLLAGVGAAGVVIALLLDTTGGTVTPSAP